MNLEEVEVKEKSVSSEAPDDIDNSLILEIIESPGNDDPLKVSILEVSVEEARIQGYCPYN
jgi:hypothetical protein